MWNYQSDILEGFDQIESLVEVILKLDNHFVIDDIGKILEESIWDLKWKLNFEIINERFKNAGHFKNSKELMSFYFKILSLIRDITVDLCDSTHLDIVEIIDNSFKQLKTELKPYFIQFLI